MTNQPSPGSPKLKELEAGVAAASSSAGDAKFLQHVDHENADVALKVLESEDEPVVITPEEERALLRKIDWYLMPLMCIVYGLNYLDKTTISYASVMGLKTDLHLVGQQYSWLGSMFYFGYLFWEYPTNRLLQLLPLGKWSGVNVILWGAVLCCMAATTDFAGAMVVRFLLGVFEAAVTPGFALFTSQWYTAAEQGSRTAIWFSFNGWFQILGGVMAYGIAIGTEQNPLTIKSWQMLFLVIGLFTCVLGGLFLFFMPDNQLNAWFLTDKEKIMAVERIRKNQQGVGNKHFKWYQMKEALLDPVAWAFVFYSFIADIPNGGISNFFSQLIVSFGFTNEQSLLVAVPAGAVEVIALILCGYIGDRFKNRLLVSLFGMAATILGMFLILFAPGSVGKLIGYYLTLAMPTGFVAILSMISTNVAGYTKKTTVAAMYLIAYCVGNIIGPQLFLASESPNYPTAKIVITVCLFLAAVDVVFIYFWYRRLNAKKAAERAAPGYVKIVGQEFYDLTDGENPEFVFAL
ncbi:hypothetical protein HK405_003137 [Cladochytrium tenue]|nr:hypothetical protein HK405_003137 [Cladochytrium tenue]